MLRFESLESRQLFATFGQPIKSFGATGISDTNDLGGTSFAEIATMPTGEIFAADNIGLVKLRANGSILTGYGTAGFVKFGSFSYRDHTVDSAGRVFVLAGSATGTVVIRYTATGQLDETFGSGGVVLVEKSQAFRARSIKLQSNGKILIAGIQYSSSASDKTRVYRLTSAGVKDTAFGTSGIAEFSLGAGNLLTPQTEDSFIDMRVLTDDKIAVLGSSYSYQPAYTDTDTGEYFEQVDGSTQVGLKRLSADGKDDNSAISGSLARRNIIDESTLAASSGTIRADGSAMIEIDSGSLAKYVGVSAGGAISVLPVTPGGKNLSNPYDATALSDGRVVFTSKDGRVWYVAPSGATSDLVRPILGLNDSSYSITQIQAAPDGNLLELGSNGDMKIAKFYAGTLGEPPTNVFAGALATSTTKDQYGQTHVAFFDAGSKTLKYVSKNQNGLWGDVYTVDSTPGAGANLSIAATHVSNKRDIAIAYYDASTADLKLATSSDGRKWTLSTIAVTGAVGLNPTLLFTDAGSYAVSYFSKTKQSLYYSLYNGKSWSFEVVDHDGSGAWSEMVFDPSSRRPVIAYTGPTNTVKMAMKTKTGWVKSVAYTTTAGAAYVNLAVPYYNAPTYGHLISFYDTATADLVLLRRGANGRFSKVLVTSRGSVGAYNDLYTDYYGNADLYCYNKNSDSVLHSHVDTSNNITTSVAVTGGGKFLSTSSFSNFNNRYLYDNDVQLTYVDTATGKTIVQ